jgi:ethanolamine utilization microcompartment shell protein EutL
MDVEDGIQYMIANIENCFCIIYDNTNEQIGIYLLINVVEEDIE